MYFIGKFELLAEVTCGRIVLSDVQGLLLVAWRYQILQSVLLQLNAAEAAAGAEDLRHIVVYGTSTGLLVSIFNTQIPVRRSVIHRSSMDHTCAFLGESRHSKIQS